MKKMLIIAILMCSTMAYAESPPAAAGSAPPGASSGPPGGGDRPKMSEEEKAKRFPEFKAKMLERIKKHEACVEAAANFEAMKACHPHMGGGKGGGGGWGHRRGGGDEGGPGGEGGGGGDQ